MEYCTVTEAWKANWRIVKPKTNSLAYHPMQGAVIGGIVMNLKRGPCLPLSRTE